MPLPKETDERIRKRFNKLIKDGAKFILRTNEEMKEAIAGIKVAVETPAYFGIDRIEYGSLMTSLKSLFNHVLSKSRYDEILSDIQNIEKDSYFVAFQKAFGTLQGLKADYESGMLDDLSQKIEKNVTYDYMSQAAELLAGKRHQYDHVPAAVLAGAVLEDALRRLCQRQNPPLDTKTNGKAKTLEPLITDLQTANVFNNAKADQLRSWAKIRNAAAHGRFDEFDRSQVDEMIPSVKNLLADYL
ncbi:MAG: hypothetical protein OXF22_09585 [Anaerolineaceae bacterium]|nr:hypothetical protein [Anaerolineaceae bacterium]